MSIIIKPTSTKDFTKIKCPKCNQRVKGIGVLKESKIDGLTFVCNTCKSTWEIKTS